MTGRLNLLKWLGISGTVLNATILSFVVYTRLPEFSPLALFFGLVLLASTISIFIFFEFSTRDMRRRERELLAHQRITQAVGTTLDLAEILARALDVVLELTHAAAGRVWLVEPATRLLRNSAHRGLFPEAFAEPAVLDWSDELARSVAESARAGNFTELNRLSNVAQLRAKGFVEFASVPLVARGHVVGVIDVAARHRGELGTATQELLRSMGREVGQAIEQAHLFQAMRERQSDAEQLYKTGMDVSSKLQLGQVLDIVTERGRALLDVDASALCLWDQQNRWLVIGSQSGPSEAFESPARIGQRVAQRIHMLRIDAEHPDDQGHLGDCVTCALIRAPYQSAHIEMPLHVDDHQGDLGQVIGCLCVSSSHPRTFSDREIKVLGGLADQAAIAIQNARAFDQAGNAAIVMERERLAREMHDTLAQVLGFMNTKSQAVRELLDTGRIDAARAQVDHLTDLAQKLSTDVREVILGLRTALSPAKSLIPALGDYVQAFSQQSGIDAQMIIEAEAGTVTFAPAVELQMIRIVQESLTNIRKHAQARHAIVRFATLDGHAEMRIEDDGRGFDPLRIARGDWPQFGLQTMRERAESIGGAFVVVSKLNGGTHIVVQIPLRYAGTP